jgi:hypothetical protein
MQEPVGPFYSEEEGFSITYPTFIHGEMQDMRYFKNPGRIVPEEELPSDLHIYHS